MKRYLPELFGSLAGAAFALLLTGTMLLALPFAHAGSRLYRLRRASLRDAAPDVVTRPQDLLLAVAADRRVSPSVRARVALEQARLQDFPGAESTLRSADRELRHARESLLAPLRDRGDLEFQSARVQEAWLCYRGMTLPAPADPAGLIAMKRRMILVAPDAVVGAVSRGDFPGALELALGEKAEPTALQPVRSIAYIAYQQNACGDRGAGETLRLGRQIAAGMSNWWPVGSDSGYRDRALAAIAVIQAEIGDTEGARETFALTVAQHVGDAAAQDLAAIFAFQDRPTEALGMLWNIVDPDQRAQAAIEVAQLMILQG